TPRSLSTMAIESESLPGWSSDRRPADPRQPPERSQRETARLGLGGESRRGAREDLDSDRERALVDAKSGGVMGRRRVALGPCAEHEVAARNSRQKLREVVADGQRPAEHAGPVTDELIADLEDFASDVRLVHERHRSVHEVDVRLHLELAFGLTQQVVQAIQCLLAKRIVERPQAALDQDAARDDVPCAVAAAV